MDPLLAPTEFVQSSHPAIVARVDALGLRALPPRERAARLFAHVRDDVRYDFMAKLSRDEYLASNVLAANRGFCVQKAVLLAALGRASRLRTAIVLCDMRDHALPDKMVKILGTDVMAHHGLNAIEVEGTFRLVDASLDPLFLERKRLPRSRFDGTADALLPERTIDGGRAAEYLVFHHDASAPEGRFADLPFDRTIEAFVGAYANADLAALVAMGLKL